MDTTKALSSQMSEMKEVRQLSDYIFNYIGCEAIIGKQSGHDNAKDLIGTLVGYDTKNKGTCTFLSYDKGMGTSYITPTNIQLLLRPLQSLTDDEKAALVEEVTHSHVRFSSKESALGCFDNDEYAKKIQHQVFLVDEINWLRRRSFDVDRLIENGLAIDKTTYKQQ